PKIFGKKLDERLGKAHFWFTFLGITLVFAGQLLAGYAGQQRRLFDPFQYTFIQGLRGLNRWTSYFAFALFAGQFIFVWNFFKTLFGKTAPVSENPWGVTTLEWTATTSPPPFHNCERIPAVVRGPHVFAYAVVRFRAPIWPPPDQPRLPILLPGLNTVLIAASSGLVAVAVRATAIGRPRRAFDCLGVAAILGALFLMLQVVVWASLW